MDRQIEMVPKDLVLGQMRHSLILSFVGIVIIAWALKNPLMLTLFLFNVGSYLDLESRLDKS
jgi:hypothetical protein